MRTNRETSVDTNSLLDAVYEKVVLTASQNQRQLRKLQINKASRHFHTDKGEYDRAIYLFQ